MQDLLTNATGGYTYAQVYERLTSGGAVHSCRFDILDNNLNKLTNLGSIQAFETMVEYDTSRQIVGSLGLTMLPNEAINLPYVYRIRPWFQLEMLDGGLTEWPMGVYLWNKPQRDNLGRPDEYWTLTLGDLGTLLQLAGPGAAGHVAPAGSVISTMVAQIVGGLGMDTSGIVHTDAQLSADLHWGVYGSRKTADDAMARYHARYVAWTQAEANWRKEIKHLYSMGLPGHHAKSMDLHKLTSLISKVKRAQPKKPVKPQQTLPFSGQPGTAWIDILTQLHQMAGFFPPWFDLTGRYRATPQPDLPTAVEVRQYTDGSSGTLVTPGQQVDDLSALCNRVYAQGSSASGYYDLGVADLDVLVPGHPLSQRAIGFYIDVVVQDQVSTTPTGLLATATAELHRRVNSMSQYNMDTLPWPVHEAFDILGLTMSQDAEIGAGVKTLETNWSLDLRTGEMTHVMQQITPGTAATIGQTT